MDMDLERAKRVIRIAGLQVAGCVGGCAKRVPYSRRAARHRGVRITMLGDLWQLSACPRCLGAFAERVDEEVGYAQEPPERGMALSIHNHSGPWHLATRRQNPVSPGDILFSLCGRELPLTSLPARMLRFMAVGYPQEHYCESCLRSTRPDLAVLDGTPIFQIVRAAAIKELVDAGHDPALLNEPPRIAHVSELDQIVAGARPNTIVAMLLAQP